MLFHDFLFISSACVEDGKTLADIKAQICQLPVQQFEGIGDDRNKRSQCVKETLPKYHFNPATQSCEVVEFSGCFGTDNLFDKEDECRQFCDDDAHIKAIDEEAGKLLTTPQAENSSN